MEELYKLDNNTLKWRRLADMNEPRGGITNSCLEWNGSIWVFGGVNGNGHLKSVERYDPKEDKWTRVSDMKYARSSAAATVHNSKFIVCGGYNGSILKNVECFEPESGIWIQLTDLPAPRSSPSLISFENRLILMGGSDGRGAVNSVWELGDLKECGTWKVLTSMRHPRHSASVVVLNKEIYLIGGDGQPRGVEIFDGGKWRNGHRLPIDCDLISSVVIPNNLVDALRER